jgi:ComF family protein
LLAQQIEAPAPILLPVPLHWWRYLSRGYNQSDILAHSLRAQLNNHPRVASNLFKRHRSTPKQQGLDKRQRQKNLSGAFKLNKPFYFKYFTKQSQKQPSNLSVRLTHVAIIDDVVTTGTTVQQLCKLLLDIGVERIDIYCICRTPEAS